MFELRSGSARLVYALTQRANDPATIKRLALVLNYQPSQLQEDIEALREYYEQTTAEDAE